MRYLLVFLFITGFTYWGLQTRSLTAINNPSSQNIITKATTHAYSSRGPASYCLLCQFPSPDQYKAESQNPNFCEDLFAAACPIDAEPSSFTPLDFSPHKDRAAQAMGYEDFDEALKARLADAGLTVKDNVPQSSWQSFKDLLQRPLEIPAYENQNLASDIFSSVQSCDSIDPSTITPQLTTTYQQQMRRRHAGAFSQDLPNYYNHYLSEQCRLLTQERILPEQNQQLESICKRKTEVRRAAVLLYRQEEQPGYLKRAERFIYNNWIPPIVMPPRPEELGGGPPLSAEDQAFSQLVGSYLSHCSYDQHASIQAARSITLNLNAEIQISRPHVEGVINEVYSPARRQQLENMFNILRSDAQALVPQLTSDRQMQSRIISEYDNVELFWMQAPPDTAYQSVNGAQILHSDYQDGEIPLAAIFNDTHLEYFNEVNATYRPQMTLGGEHSSPETVNITPGLLNALEENPYSLASIMAHELGHKIGPELSRLNSHDLSQSYEDLLACYSSPESIRMQANQKDEVIADFISAEVMAAQISKLPQNQRRSAAVAMTKFWCQTDHSPLDCKAQHPDGMLRVNGILAANPNIRQVVGCPAEAKDFKTCGIEGVSLLDTENEASLSSTGESHPQDEVNVRGVQ